MATLPSLRERLVGLVAAGCALAGCSGDPPAPARPAPPSPPPAGPTATATATATTTATTTAATTAATTTPPDNATTAIAAPTPAPPSTAAPPPTTAAPPATAEAPPAPTRIAKPDWCKAPIQHCRAPFSPPDGQQLPGPSPGPFDARGCLPREAAFNMCSGKLGLDGPQFRGGQCCYSICQGPVPPCGRPLLVAGGQRAAAVVGRGGWG